MEIAAFKRQRHRPSLVNCGQPHLTGVNGAKSAEGSNFNLIENASSRLERQLDAVTRLPQASQKAVSQMLDAMIVQYGIEATGQEANAA